jgi:protein-S-isoprenylcysteine O-methyltransferase Ste14
MNATAKRFLQIGLGMVANAVLLFGAAGRLDWAWAWVSIALSAAVVGVNILLLLPRHRDLIAERAGVGAGAKRWDKWVASLATLFVAGGTPVLAGLDVRYGWMRGLPLHLHAAGLAGFLGGYALLSWAMSANRFFSTFVRIQKDRGHTVVDSGPYRGVRHPGYVGWIVTALGTPLLLGSLWALVPAGVGAALMVARTAMEDRTLRRELDGYEAYAGRVRYRLLPGIW